MRNVPANALTPVLVSLSLLGCSSTTAPVPDGSTNAQPPSLQLLHKVGGADQWTAGTSGFWGDPIDLRVSGLAPGAVVSITATTGMYHATASFAADSGGVIDLATTAPAAGGSYAGVDADGLLWSASTDEDPPGYADYPITYVVNAPGFPSMSLAYQRWWLAPGGKMTKVTDQGLVGVLAVPDGAGPHPALLVLGGSDGGISSAQLAATYYASLGYVTLGLAYFGEPGLPSTLTRIPLEYFDKAITWLSARPEVSPGQVGVIGTSRGGELALLLGATNPKIKAVIAIAPSGYVWGGGSDPTPSSAWTFAGQDVPFVPSSGAAPMVGTDDRGRTIEKDAPMFLADIAAASASALAAATIAVEKTNGPVLILSGDDDQLWASCALSKVAAARLQDRQPKRADQVVCYPETGHFIFVPGFPTVGQSESYLAATNSWLAIGGTPPGAAHAARDADGKIRAFLQGAFH